MPAPSPRVKELFNAAVEITDATARREYLDCACGEDADLRCRLEDLLSAHDRPADIPGRLAHSITGDYAGKDEVVGAVLAGKYKLLQALGDGGMGSVWMADQLQPVKRRVAVKVIKAGLDSSRILARFEAERQALALMDHPNIAKVLDAGATEAGRPYFVMELVKGVPLTEYCDTGKLTIAERLNLFMKICSAVQHAHQKGIIHRDLKPGNILVESHDGVAVPKVIDFGLAKATTGVQLSDRTLFTALGTVAGTPLYMAPEQAAFNAVDIDTRADIYALGVILYELLTGTTPIEREMLKKAAFDEILRVIREQEPATPSSRLSSSESKANVAALRQMEPMKLGRFLKGDLDWIVMKALSKDRARRYETANGFARDVERFLNREPVSAGPPGTGYKLKKFVQRNRGQVMAGLLVLLTLIAGIVSTAIGWDRALRERDEARAARAETALERDAKGRALDDANEQRAVAEAINVFLQFGILRQADSREQAEDGGEQDPDITIKKALNRAAAKIGDKFRDRPMIEAGIRRSIGDAYVGIGEPRLGIPHLKRAVELYEKLVPVEHPEHSAALDSLGLALIADGDGAAAIPILDRALQAHRVKLGEDARETISCHIDLTRAYVAAGDDRKAIALLEVIEKQAREKLGPDHDETFRARSEVAACFMNIGEHEKAIPLFERLIADCTAKRGANHPSTLTAQNNLAISLQEVGQMERARDLLQSIVEIRRGTIGPEHPDTLMAQVNLGMLLNQLQRYREAIPLLEEALKVQRKRLGTANGDTLTTQGNLANAYWRSGTNKQEALQLYEDVLKGRTALFGPDYIATIASRNDLAKAYQDQGDHAKSLPLIQRNLQSLIVHYGPDHAGVHVSRFNLATSFWKVGQKDKAISEAETGYLAHVRKLGPDHPYSIGMRLRIVEWYGELKRHDDAEKLCREHITCLERTNANPVDRAEVQSILGGILLAQKKYQEAAPLLREGYDALVKHIDNVPPRERRARLAEALDRLVRLARESNAAEDLKKWQAEQAKLPRETAPRPRVLKP